MKVVMSLDDGRSANHGMRVACGFRLLVYTQDMSWFDIAWGIH